jgi:hypothetical protein
MWATGDGIIAGKIFQTSVTDGAHAGSISVVCLPGFHDLCGFSRSTPAIKIVPNTGRRRQ